jgi:hypothetical protein
VTVTRAVLLVAVLACMVALAEQCTWTRVLAVRLMASAARTRYVRDPARRTRREEEWQALGQDRRAVVFLAVAACFLVSSLVRQAPGRVSPAAGVRVIVALPAALLMSEMILMQVFAGDMALQIQADRLAVSLVTQHLLASYESSITGLQNQIVTAQEDVASHQNVVADAYNAMDCQEFGCPGIAAGLGPGYAAARENLHIAYSRLDDAQVHLKSIRAADQPKIAQLDSKIHRTAGASQSTPSGVGKVLSQEKAFWHLTMKNCKVLIVWVVLSLLLGTGMTCALIKLNGRKSNHGT